MEILFDLDGTLTDPGEGILSCVRHALRELGEPVPAMDELRWCVGPPLKNAFITLFGPEQPERVAEAVRHFRERFSEVGLFENEVYPGIPEMLAKLRSDGYDLHVATSKPGVFATRILDHFGLTVFFSSVYGSELDGTRADKAELIDHLLRERGLNAEAIMIGDREHDMIGARANGMKGIGVLWGYGDRHELEGAGAVLCAASPADVPAAVRKVEAGWSAP